MIWPLWPGCAFLVAVLLLAPRKFWPALLVAGLAGFVTYDLQAGLTIRSIALLNLGDTVEILIAALGVSYTFGGMPRLNSVKSLARYSLFAVVLAPSAAASVSASVLGGDYWVAWRVSFFTEALALLALTPAILGWAGAVFIWGQKRRAFYLEAALLVAGLLVLGYITFIASGVGSRPVLLYSLVPFLLWSALRFGVTGTSTSMIVVAFLSIWGAVRGRGPFTGPEPLTNVFSLQLFLLFAAIPFMVLAALAEERKQSEEARKKSEEKFLKAFRASPVAIALTSAKDHRYIEVNDTFERLTGYRREEVIGRTPFDIGLWVEPSRREELTKRLLSEGGVRDREVHYRVKDGSIRIGLTSADLIEIEGEPYVLAVTSDITDRKQAEEALSHASRRLIEAQEKERNRIGRDLHDDIGQRLALLAVGLQQMKQAIPDSAVEVSSRLDELWKQTSEISADVQALSHDLHSSKLEYLGIVAAMRGFCREFGEKQKMEIEFESHDLPSPLPTPEISLSLFRVLQEALHNAVKHSGVRHVEVQLWGSPGEIHLTVSDSGAGFNTQAAKEGAGLGLTSMEERLKLVNGELSVESQPQRGTAIHARVPLRSKSDSMRAGG
jgi:PAS domain S-box-containing protein